MKHIRKFSLALILTLVLSTVLLPISASAAAPTDDAKVPSPKEVVTLYCMVESANVAIELAVRIAQRTPYNDVPLLLCTVERISDGVMDYAESIGAEVACEYTEYVIDGQTVFIDPLRVINIPSIKSDR